MHSSHTHNAEKVLAPKLATKLNIKYMKLDFRDSFFWNKYTELYNMQASKTWKSSIFSMLFWPQIFRCNAQYLHTNTLSFLFGRFSLNLRTILSHLWQWVSDSCHTSEGLHYLYKFLRQRLLKSALVMLIHFLTDQCKNLKRMINVCWMKFWTSF